MAAKRMETCRIEKEHRHQQEFPGLETFCRCLCVREDIYIFQTGSSLWAGDKAFAIKLRGASDIMLCVR